MNKKQLEKELKELGVEVPEKATNKELHALLDEANKGSKQPEVSEPLLDTAEPVEPKPIEPVLDKPGWLDTVVWDSLNEVQKQAVCKGMALGDARKL